MRIRNFVQSALRNAPEVHASKLLLVGEATRVSGEARKGIASAYGGRGTFARCEYQMSTPYMGAGTCTFSNGAETSSTSAAEHSGIDRL